MATTNISPNMNMPVPAVGEDPGPDWATNLVASLSIVDSHNHGAGQGVQITPDGINISSDLPMGANNLTLTRTVRFDPQSAALSLPTDLTCVYVASADLYYNDASGNQVRITQGGSVTGSTGTITGLPSGTASASYSAGTFTFQGATSTPATMAVGPLVIGRAVASSFTVTLAPNSGQGSNFAITLPAALPASTAPMTLDATGNISVAAVTGSGNVVQSSGPTIATATLTNPTVTTGTFATPAITTPAFTGAPTGTISAGTYAPNSVNISGVLSSITGVWYTRIGNRVTVGMYVTGTSSAGGLLSYNLDLPFAPTSNFANIYQIIGGVFCVASPQGGGLVQNVVWADVGSKLAIVFVDNEINNVYTYNQSLIFSYDCT